VYDLYWGMPTENWLQQGSFLEAISAPTGDPDTGTLYQLPCISQEYIPLLLGALDQLRNPSTWDPTLTTAQLAQALDRVDQLRHLFADAVNVPCCSYQLQFTSGCALQYSTDGGTTWTDVAGWDSNFPTCVQANVPAPLTNPQGQTVAQQQCAVAAYLAKEIIQASIASLSSSYSENNSALAAAGDLATVLAAVGFVWTAGFVDLVSTVYSLYTSTTAPHFEYAQTDPNLASAVTCCIYQHMGSSRGINDSNFTAIRNCVCALTYTYSEVITAICAMFDNWGVTGIQALESGAALYEADCSGCGGWCWERDLTLANGSINPNADAPYCVATWVSGTGWKGCYASSPNLTESSLQYVSADWGGFPVTCSSVEIDFLLTGHNSGTYQSNVKFYHTGTLLFTDNITSTAYNPLTTAHFVFPGGPLTIDEIWIHLYDDGNYVQQVSAIRLCGSGTNPIGANNCVCS
jgi:hypothetical protein